MIGLIPTLISAHLVGYQFERRRIGISLLIPSTVAFFLFIFGIHPLIGIPLILVISLLAYTRFQIITKNDLSEISRVFFSDESLSRIYLYAKPILRILYGE
jgi:hypothetical protein